MVPSDKQLTVTPCGPTSAARPREKPMAAAFAAPYTTCLRSPRRPASETIVSTLPHERSTIAAGRAERSFTPRPAAARASWMQRAAPTPPPPPVTMATRPAMKFDQSRIVATAGSDLYDDGDDRRAPLRPLVDEPAQGAPRVPADRLEVGGALLGRLRQRGEHRGPALLEELVRLGGVDPAAGHDLGP